ncbi:MAG: phosphoribosylanthranilate isomerase [Candidatus Entotheonellia bacterium]
MGVMRVKICCIQSREEAAVAVRYGAAAIGLVSAMPSGSGILPEDRIAAIAAGIPPGVASCLLTSRQDAAAIIAQQRRCRVNTLQLCNRLQEGTYEELHAALPGVHLMQVIHVTGVEALHEAQAVAPYVDGIVLDSGGRDLSSQELGGTGRTHDWHISSQICRAVQVPVFLAGGLRPANVAAAIKQVRPYGVDVCSGMRTDGQLDEEKVRAFFVAINLTNTVC